MENILSSPLDFGLHGEYGSLLASSPNCLARRYALTQRAAGDQYRWKAGWTDFAEEGGPKGTSVYLSDVK